MQFSIGYILRQVRADAEYPVRYHLENTTQYNHKPALPKDEINVQAIIKAVISNNL